MRLQRIIILALLVAGATAQADSGGFQLNRYEPTAPGDWFLSVPHPWYSSTRYFAAGLTLDYAHNPLVYGSRDAAGNFTQENAVVAHQLVGHVDLAGSLFDRVNLGVTLPVTLVERGDNVPGIGASAISGAAVGDPRVSLMVRLWNQPDKDPLSIHIGGSLWIPIGAEGSHAGDVKPRGAPKLVLAGLGLDHIRWSAVIGYLIRSGASIGNVPASGSSIGQEVQIQAAAQYTDHDRTWAVGPEVSFSIVPSPSGSDARTIDYTSTELSVSGHYFIKRMVLLSAAVGIGLLRDPGTPDARVLLRAAWAPARGADRDGDGIPDDEDACPDRKGIKDNDPKKNGCPPDRDGDGVPDDDDLCPDVPRGDRPDAARLGCPIGDRDKDGVLDDVDQCPDVHKGDNPDPDKLGCPLSDRDKDGVPDVKDQCPDVPKGDKPDPDKLGCPLAEKPKTDRDGDGVYDYEDQCPDVHQGTHPDPAKLGCPLPDADGDNVPDAVDACPNQPGAPDPDPKKNGCPGLVTFRDGKINILAPVFFATDKDIILPKSFPVLTAVANVLKIEAGIKRISIDGHTDAKGNFAHNMDLSDRRAKSVMKWLGGSGIVADRMEAHGYGPTRPIASNKTNPGRAANRRVEFLVLDPAPPKSDTPPPAAAPAPEGKPGKPGKAGRAPKAPRAKGGHKRRGR